MSSWRGGPRQNATLEGTLWFLGFGFFAVLLSTSVRRQDTIAVHACRDVGLAQTATNVSIGGYVNQLSV